jgi:hypothetical protein
MRYLLITLKVRDGEREHTHRCLHTTKAKSLWFAAQRYVSTFWGYGEREDDFWWFDNEITAELDHFVELTESEYNFISAIFSGNRLDVINN